MKKKGMLIFTFLMLVCNTLTMYYVNRALKQEINIYVVQVGRYKEKANAENTMKQIEELGYKSSMYQDQEYVVITDIFIKQKEAHQQAKEIAEKGNTCVVKEYFIDDRYQENIEKKEYNLPGYVPITLQTFMVCLIALIAPCKVAVSACVVYLLMGAVGLPVFAGFQGGMGSLLGYSGGYIFSFPIMVYVISKLKTRVPIGLACIIGSVICYFIGTLWFMFVTKMNLSASLMMCVVPFIPGDLIKIVLAYCLSKKIKVKL